MPGQLMKKIDTDVIGAELRSCMGAMKAIL